MSVSHDLQRSIKLSLNHHKEGSFNTRHDREKMLIIFAKNLVSCGYKLRNIKGLKQKHIEVVTKLWQSEGLVPDTIKNRMSAIRYLCAKINKSNIVPSNHDLNIANRTYVPKKNRAIHNPNFIGITNSYVLMSLELQRVFGLRREESLKIKPFMADKKDKLELLPS